MKGKRIVAFTALGIVILVAAGTCDLFYGWPIIRNSSYRSLISDFSRATPREPTAETANQPSEWNFVVQLPKGVEASVKSGSMNVPEIRYSDEREPRRPYVWAHYSYPIALRTNGTMLYIYWGETLLHTDYRLLVFDLANRREVQRRKVDARDMPPILR